MGKRSFVDRIGQVFGRLTIIDRAENKNGNVHWVCACECGTVKIIRSGCLTHSGVKSCGCLRQERKDKVKVKSIRPRRPRLYIIWIAIKRRCYDTKYGRYRDYGARGIVMCNEWRNNFAAFRDWALANGYQDHLTIDRKDNDGNYCPENCQWSTRKEQANNKRNTIWIDCPDGQQRNLTQLAELIGLKRSVLANRYNNSPSISYEELISPLKTRGKD